jgi:hypothetical protein
MFKDPDQGVTQNFEKWLKGRPEILNLIEKAELDEVINEE